MTPTPDPTPLGKDVGNPDLCPGCNHIWHEGLPCLAGVRDTRPIFCDCEFVVPMPTSLGEDVSVSGLVQERDVLVLEIRHLRKERAASHAREEELRTERDDLQAQVGRVEMHAQGECDYEDESLRWRTALEAAEVVLSVLDGKTEFEKGVLGMVKKALGRNISALTDPTDSTEEPLSPEAVERLLADMRLDAAALADSTEEDG